MVYSMPVEEAVSYNKVRRLLGDRQANGAVVAILLVRLSGRSIELRCGTWIA
jgi:hypothetical protein